MHGCFGGAASEVHLIIGANGCIFHRFGRQLVHPNLVEFLEWIFLVEEGLVEGHAFLGDFEDEGGVLLEKGKS